jgi:hypothetical protein
MRKLGLELEVLKNSSEMWELQSEKLYDRDEERKN